MSVPPIAYTNRDFDTIKQALVLHVKSKFPNTWKDFTESSIGMALLELTAYCFDVLSYYLDVVANECFLPTAKDRESVLLLCKLIGYRLRPATASSVLVRCSLPQEQDRDVIIAAGTEFYSNKRVVFECLQDILIPKGEKEVLVYLTQGTTVRDTFESTGEPFQEFKLTQAPLIEGSVKVEVDGIEWEQIDSLIGATGVDTNWSLSTDLDDYGYIKFGDGVSGCIPPPGATIVCTYRVGGGVQGNIPIGDIDMQVNGELAGVEPRDQVQVSVYNIERGSGGEERETIEHAKYWAPKSVVANGRAVTEQDFDTLANTFSDPVYGAPAYAKAYLKQTVPELNTVQIAVWSRDELGNITTPSSGLKDAISNYFNNNGKGAVRIITVDCEVVDGDIVYIDLDVQVVSDGTIAQVELMNNVTQAILDWFSINSQPGEDIRLSKLYSLIQSQRGVANALIKRLTASSQMSETIGTSDGTIKQWDYIVQQLPIPNSITIQAGEQTITDDGEGRLIGDIDEGYENTVDYTTGELNFAFLQAPPESTVVSVTYRSIIRCYRNEVDVAVGDGYTSHFRGYLSYSPIAPNTFVITDTVQVVRDDGTGRLVGDIDITQPAVIDYTAGMYDFTFKTPPGAGMGISCIYTQLLDVKAGDVHIDKNQLAVLSTLDVRVQHYQED